MTKPQAEAPLPLPKEERADIQAMVRKVLLAANNSPRGFQMTARSMADLVGDLLRYEATVVALENQIAFLSHDDSWCLASKIAWGHVAHLLTGGEDGTPIDFAATEKAALRFAKLEAELSRRPSSQPAASSGEPPLEARLSVFPASTPLLVEFALKSHRFIDVEEFDNDDAAGEIAAHCSCGLICPPEGNEWMKDTRVVWERHVAAIVLAAKPSYSQVMASPSVSPAPSTTPENLLAQLRAADLTTRHLTTLHETKQAARTTNTSAPFGDCTMVEAIILWWETGIRSDTLSEPYPFGLLGEIDRLRAENAALRADRQLLIRGAIWRDSNGFWSVVGDSGGYNSADEAFAAYRAAKSSAVLLRETPPMASAFTLRDFVAESNRIEGIGRVTEDEIDAHTELLEKQCLAVADLEDFVSAICGKPLRDKVGMNVRVGDHYPPPGGPPITTALGEILQTANHPRTSPYTVHVHYEKLHPFMDGNGRSGRALWLWQMGGIKKAPLGFLHHFYYQTLDASQNR